METGSLIVFPKYGALRPHKQHTNLMFVWPCIILVQRCKWPTRCNKFFVYWSF